MESVSDQDELDYDLASPGARMGARLIDTVIGLGVWITLFFIIVAANDIDVTDTELDVVDAIPSGAALLLRWSPFIVWFVYEVFLTSTRGQTAGKIVTRIKVVSVADGGPPPWSPAAIRWAVLALPMALIPDILGPAASALVGFWFVWDAKRQGLHDKAASTYVVKKPLPVPSN